MSEPTAPDHWHRIDALVARAEKAEAEVATLRQALTQEIDDWHKRAESEKQFARKKRHDDPEEANLCYARAEVFKQVAFTLDKLLAAVPAPAGTEAE